jgi:chromatin segregation and condensation protein Rec8/ScpA/Scc1 (kleisin family)
LKQAATYCRAMQREYFQTRSHETLRAAKSAEQRVDRVLADIERQKTRGTQKTIFTTGS